MIVAVCADKGSPGVTTLTTALGMVWPGQRLVLESDPSGGDLAFWARHASGNGLLTAEPSIVSLAAASRSGPSAGGLSRYAQPTAWGVDVVQGAPGAQGFAPLRSLWQGVAEEAARWPGMVIADLGRLQPGSPVLPLAHAATAVLLLARVSVEGLFHLRERVADLAAGAAGAGARTPTAVVVTAPKREAKDAAAQVTRMLSAVGSPASLAGVFLHDPAAAAELRAGTMGKQLRDGDLLASAAQIAGTVRSWWPNLEPRPAAAPSPSATSSPALNTSGDVTAGHPVGGSAR